MRALLWDPVSDIFSQNVDTSSELVNYTVPSWKKWKPSNNKIHQLRCKSLTS